MQLNTSIARLKFNPPEENALLSSRTNPTAVAECKDKYYLKMSGVSVAQQKQVGGSKIYYIHEHDDMCLVLQHLDSLIIQAINANAKSWFPGRRVEYERIEEDYRKSIEFKNSLLGKFVIYGEESSTDCKNVDIVFELYGIMFRRQNYSAIWKVVSVQKTTDEFNKYLIDDEQENINESESEEDLVPLDVCKEMRCNVMSKLDSINHKIQEKIKECQTAPLNDINITQNNNEFVESMLKNMYANCE